MLTEDQKDRHRDRQINRQTEILKHKHIYRQTAFTPERQRQHNEEIDLTFDHNAFYLFTGASDFYI